MSVHEDWKTVDAFRALTDPEPEDIVELDIAMMRILRHFKSDRHCRAAGYSVRFPRFQQTYPDRAPEEELKILREHYWPRDRQLRKLQLLVSEKERAIERSCSHEWERDFTSHDHRSRYCCLKCGSSR